MSHLRAAGLTSALQFRHEDGGGLQLSGELVCARRCGACPLPTRQRPAQPLYPRPARVAGCSRLVTWQRCRSRCEILLPAYVWFNPLCVPSSTAASPSPLLSLAALQDSYLRTVASDSALWEPLALARWPGAHAAQHGGDWHRLYCARAPLPHAFPLAADRIRSVTAVQQQRLQQQQQPGAAVPRGALPQVAFEDVMRQTFLAGVACTA